MAKKIEPKLSPKASKRLLRICVSNSMFKYALTIMAGTIALIKKLDSTFLPSEVTTPVFPQTYPITISTNKIPTCCRVTRAKSIFCAPFCIYCLLLKYSSQYLFHFSLYSSCDSKTKSFGVRIPRFIASSTKSRIHSSVSASTARTDVNPCNTA